MTASILLLFIILPASVLFEFFIARKGKVLFAIIFPSIWTVLLIMLDFSEDFIIPITVTVFLLWLLFLWSILKKSRNKN
ncbi:hypothetical protein [Bacillus alkalicellulosilyticus]|uniref:hypothetical protein n=1 Tax=Alkalihalobacterium alkalicellulosilyticum TaxID=1912214 RepID=UPI0009970C9D|nr:hypothetical protein [Bacillus alkalicellulosilyticus]